jgi:cysteine desulfurase
MRIYLDNNATTPLHPAVLEALGRSFRDVFGNASSIHKEGQSARHAIEDARESVAKLLAAEARDIIFTSGGTESNNAAIFGAAGQDGRHHIVTTAIEHPSVLEPVAELERRGHAVTIVAPSRHAVIDGVVDADAVIAAIRPETRLVSMMLANNETGVIQPVADVARVCRERSIHFHCDAVQGAGKVELDVSALGIDTLALSAHKLHAPKGIGALYVRRGLSLDRHILGGAQERRRRAGTENVPLAVAFGVAAEIARDRADVDALRDALERRLAEFDIVINGASVPRIPNTSSVTFRNADAEGIVIGLDLNGVAVSTGAACSSGRVEPSHVLLAMGLTPDEARSTIRFSLSRFSTMDEIDRTVELLREIVPRCVSSAVDRDMPR